MAVRFKFRSSVNFDSVDIEGQPSISVRDLKSKILHNQNVNIVQDFDLVFSDPISGQEYCDEKIQIPSGSSVVVKRVPAGSVRSDPARVAIKETNAVRAVRASHPVNIEIDDFDDFGAELCPVPEATMCSSDIDVDKKIYFTNDKKNIEVPRCFETPLVRCQKHETSDLSEAIPREILHMGDEENASEINSKPNVKEYVKLEKVATANPQVMQNADLPSELKCSLCDTLLTEAVMIPCCQRSFCETCIQNALVVKKRCPQCSSTKCRLEDLLPNVSLRQAIHRFLQSQILIKGSDNAFDHYAPDGESGIQGKEMSYAVSIQQREAELPESPSATGRGSNQVITEPVGGKSVLLSSKLKQINGERLRNNQPMHEEAESTVKKKRDPWVDAAGLGRSSAETGRHKKGERVCYVCGSPDHFMRDCPDALSPHPMIHSGSAMFPGVMPGCMPPYWNGTPFPQMRPFVDSCGNPGMMPFNATMVPPTTFGIPACVPSVFGGTPGCGGFTRMGGVVAPVGTGLAWHLGHSHGGELQDYEKRQKLLNENLRRKQLFNNDEGNSFSERLCDNEVERSHDRRCQMDREVSISYSEDSFTQKSCRKHRRYDYSYEERERSNSEVEDMAGRSYWHGEKRHKHHHRNSKKNDGRRDHCGSDSSWGHRQSHKEKDRRKKVRSDRKRDKHRHHSHSESGLEPSLSSDWNNQLKVRDYRHGSRHSRQSSRSMNDDVKNDRWQMVSGSDEDGKDDYHYYKRKRVY